MKRMRQFTAILLLAACVFAAAAAETAAGDEPFVPSAVRYVAVPLVPPPEHDIGLSEYSIRDLVHRVKRKAFHFDIIRAQTISKYRVNTLRIDSSHTLAFAFMDIFVINGNMDHTHFPQFKQN